MTTKDITDVMVSWAVSKIHKDGVHPGKRFSTGVLLLQKTAGESEKVCQAATHLATGSTAWLN